MLPVEGDLSSLGQARSRATVTIALYRTDSFLTVVTRRGDGPVRLKSVSVPPYSAHDTSQTPLLAAHPRPLVCTPSRPSTADRALSP